MYVITLLLFLFKCTLPLSLSTSQQNVALLRNIREGSEIKEALRCLLSHKKVTRSKHVKGFSIWNVKKLVIAHHLRDEVVLLVWPDSMALGYK